MDETNDQCTWYASWYVGISDSSLSFPTENVGCILLYRLLSWFRCWFLSRGLGSISETELRLNDVDADMELGLGLGFGLLLTVGDPGVDPNHAELPR